MNRIWYISPSNQSANIGIGSYGSEQEQMYALALEIAPHLDRAGVSFIMPERNAALNQRVRQSNEMGCCFHLALHSNAGGRGQAYGPVALYYSETGRDFAEKLTDALLALRQHSNRSYHVKQQKSLYELRNTKAPAVLLEVDFHDSQVGAEFITSRRREIGEAIAKVIIAADGKQFIQAGPNEMLEEAVRLGLFGENPDWDAPVVCRDLAHLALRLRQLLGGG
jgi:N-acetylmuramoyl-L-alanine amidase